MITWRVELFGQLSRFRCKLPSLVGKPENRLPSSWDSQNCVWQPTNKRLNKKKKATLCPERTADWDRSPEDAFKLPAGFWWQIIFRQDIRLERKWQIRFSRKVWLKSTENEDELDFGNKLRKTNPFNWKNSCMELRLISPYTYLYTSGLYTYGEPVEVFTDRGAKVGPGHCHQAWNGTTPLKNCWNKKVVERHICMYNIHI